MLASTGIVLEVCPTSNLLTGALADADEVRAVFRAFLDAGVRVTVSTDGPEMMRTHLRDEFAFLCSIGAMSEDEARGANALAHEVSFVTSKQVARL
jgi:aminodeoxyfutalosine deaminase